MAKEKPDLTELIAGIRAAKKLQSSLRGLIGVETIKSTGALMRTVARARTSKKDMKFDRITITSPHYGFKLNYGFEGVKSNSRYMRLQPTNHLYKAIEQTNILNELADKMGEIRAEELTAAISL